MVAMSGGVDSSTTAYLLKEKGFEVIGVTLKLWSAKETLNSQCWVARAASEAKIVADFLKIPHYTLDFSQEFKKEVVDYFLKEYAQGKTPNPCIYCNQFIKFGLLLTQAKKLGADFLATGHYARIEKNEKLGWVLKKGVDSKKDQSYFLYRLKKETLPFILFPLGNYRKQEVRKIAEEARLPISNKPESQEICFLPEGSFRHLFEKFLPQALKPGPIYNQQGEKIGTHQGVAFYTIGQRKKIGVASTEPLYVYRIDAGQNAVYVGPRDCLYQKELKAKKVNWLVEIPEGASFEAKIKIRSTNPPFEANIYKENASFKAVFKQPQAAISPGQSAVVYLREVVAGGGVIV